MENLVTSKNSSSILGTNFTIKPQSALLGQAGVALLQAENN